MASQASRQDLRIQQPVFFNTTKRGNDDARRGGSEDSARARASDDEGAKRAT